jgi:formylglycine-generating enzyme required for sulfatase activity
MTNEQAQSRSKLLQLRNSGLLNEDEYQILIDQLDIAVQHQIESSQVSVVDSQVEGSVVSGAPTIGHDFAGRDIINNIYTGRAAQSATEALLIYRRVVVAGSGHLPLRGIDIGASDPTQPKNPLELANVYIGLDTKTQLRLTKKEQMRRGLQARPGQDTWPLPALEAAADNRRLVLLGDPGSGKSTFVSHLAHCLAAHSLQPDAGWAEHLPQWPASETDLLPIVIILRDFARSLPDRLPHPATPQDLWAFFQHRLQAQNLGFAAEPIHEVLERGRVLLLLDGLDEVPTVAQRGFVRDAVGAFVERYPRNRTLVTCRVLAYQPPASQSEPDLRLPAGRFPIHELAPFDNVKIDRFIKAWYSELAHLGMLPPDSMDDLVHHLQTAMRRPDLMRLAANPLLLTVMALVHTHKGRLPDARAMLYEEAVDMLLWRWEQVKLGEQGETPRLRQLLLEAECRDIELKRLLWRLAYEAHATGVGDRDSLADIDELTLRKSLKELKGGDWNWADQVVEAMKVRAGLLLERTPSVFTLPHRTFQEYLAGAYLAAQGDFARQGADLAGQGSLWREVILLAVGRLIYLVGDVDKPLALVNRLCPAQLPASDTAWRNTWLAGNVLLEMGLKVAGEDDWGQELLTRVRDRLVDLVTGGKLTPRERAETGDTLARLGDPRPEVMTVDGMQMCLVPAGQFWMGSDKDYDVAYPEERPLHLLEIPYSYWIGLYPVTVAQFKIFLDNAGLQPQGRWGDPCNDLPNRPVRFVTWGEAIEFCQWLTELAHEKKWLSHDYCVTLPSEAEWEKAARGGEKIPVKQVKTHLGSSLTDYEKEVFLEENPEPEREYPWGSDFDPKRVYYKESGISAPCAVGASPDGKSPYGVEEMSGNIAEWTRTIWGGKLRRSDFNYPYAPADGRENVISSTATRRTVRGGSWASTKSYLTCSFPIGFDILDDQEVGFRIVVLKKS